MNCPNCGAPLKVVTERDYFVCEYCYSFVFPEENLDHVRVLDETVDYSCPICKIPLTVSSIKGNRVLSCTNCRGLLLRQYAFMMMTQFLREQPELLNSPFRPINPEELLRKIKCPSCSQPMDTHPYYGPGSVVIDVCIGCHLIWLDYGEFHKIVSAPVRDHHEP